MVRRHGAISQQMETYAGASEVERTLMLLTVKKTFDFFFDVCYT